MTKKKKQEAAAKMEMYTQYHYGWMEWAEAFDNQARYLPEDSDDWVEACKQSDLCAQHAEQALKAARHFQASTSTAVSFTLPPEPPPLLQDEDDDEAEYETDKEDDDDDPPLSHYYAEADMKGPPAGLLDYCDQCMASCTTPEQYSTMESTLAAAVEWALATKQMYTLDWANHPLIMVPDTPTPSEQPEETTTPTPTPTTTPSPTRPRNVNDIPTVDNLTDTTTSPQPMAPQVEAPGGAKAQCSVYRPTHGPAMTPALSQPPKQKMKSKKMKMDAPRAPPNTALLPPPGFSPPIPGFPGPLASPKCSK